MEAIQKFTIILFKLPDGKVVLQRRTRDAPYGAGLLGIFGGWVEEGETAEECLIREINEETNLNTDILGIKTITDFIIPSSEGFSKDRHFYLFKGDVDSLDFEVYEGDGAEAFTVTELHERNDLTDSARYVVENVLGSLYVEASQKVRSSSIRGLPGNY